MTLSLFYKEWIKLRLWWMLMLVASTAFALFLFFKLRYVYAVNDSVMIWNSWMTKAWLYYRAYQYVPLILGVVLGFMQFLPEVQANRMRLVLHLPLQEERAVGTHLLFGAVLLTIIYLPAALIFAIGGVYYFPSEWLTNLVRVFSPWLLAGYGAYFGAAAILLEHNWRHRVFYALLFAGGLRLFMRENFYDSYTRILLPLALWTVALVLIPLFSTLRFRKGLIR